MPEHGAGRLNAEFLPHLGAHAVAQLVRVPVGDAGFHA